MQNTDDLLENPVWASLAGPQSHFAVSVGSVKRYPKNVAPFVAVPSDSRFRTEDLIEILEPNEEVVLIGKVENNSLDDFRCTRFSFADQMVYEGPTLTAPNDPAIVPLQSEAPAEMIRLTSKVFPGYFRENTVRGICTHPDFQGRGYAAKLTLRAISEALAEGRQPFLHVNADNALQFEFTNASGS